MDVKQIKDDIAFWERESERCKNDANNQQGFAYYTGFVDGMKEVLSFIEHGKMASYLEIDNMIKKGLTHKKV
jgi:hypothetical protein